MGRVELLATPDILNTYDVLTYAFGDNYRYYMRGQLTIHKNNEKMKNIWRRCIHLSTFKKRLAQAMKNGKPFSVRSWGFQVYIYIYIIYIL